MGLNEGPLGSIDNKSNEAVKAVIKENTDTLDKQSIKDAHDASILTHQIEMLLNNEPSIKIQLSKLMEDMANNVENNLGNMFGLSLTEIEQLHKMDNVNISGGFTNT